MLVLRKLSLSNNKCLVMVMLIICMIHIIGVFYYIVTKNIVDSIAYDSFDNFVSSSSSISKSLLSTCCYVFKYENVGKIINCSSNDNSIEIGILSMYIKNKEGIKTKHDHQLDVNGILNNHISYVIKNRYIYFQINSLNFTKNQIKMNEFNLESNQLWAAIKLQILLSKLELVIKILTDYRNIKYLLWIDFDIFFNCSTKFNVRN